MAPLIDYMERVFLPIAARHTGFSASIRVVKRGFFPKGGGEVVLTTEPLTAPLRPIRLEDKGTVKAVRTLVYVAGTIPAGVGARIASAARVRAYVYAGGARPRASSDARLSWPLIHGSSRSCCATTLAATCWRRPRCRCPRAPRPMATAAAFCT